MKNKVLITGAGGFIGSHLVELCVQRGLNVTAFVRYNSQNNWGWLEHSKYLKEIKIITGDIRDFDSVKKAIHDCETVFHLAALIGIPYSYISPIAYLRTNIEGTYNVLQASRECNTKNIIITSTSETYGTAKYVPINEKHPIVGQSPYSASKIAADQLAISYYRSFDMPIKIVRPFNTYGPRQSARAIIPTIISQILSGRKKIYLGNLYTTRDFTYVTDTGEGFLAVSETENLFGEITNIGMNMEISINDLVKLISKIAGINIEINCDKKRLRPKNSEVDRLICDNSKILQNTNWQPKFNLESGLIDTFEYIKNNICYYKSELYNV
ncbi:MAG: GDP-mannose 4,6-dehydratase [Candidatus Cloacimonetes bacterium]|nr:GDP-mannose 4,6-dehydratase [Candidatus Cloacimonadota bacterium]MBL7086403.1 GDP-mannose 4,6-dehydratase [Candidatus Cloacimonadota bacterium]